VSFRCPPALQIHQTMSAMQTQPPHRQTCKDSRVHSGEQRHVLILSQSPDMTSSLSVLTKTRNHRHSLSQPRHRAISVSCTDEPSPDYGSIPFATASHSQTTSGACRIVSRRVTSRASRRAAMFVLAVPPLLIPTNRRTYSILVVHSNGKTQKLSIISNGFFV
jgi:hypothetical protein